MNKRSSSSLNVESEHVAMPRHKRIRFDNFAQEAVGIVLQGSGDLATDVRHLRESAQRHFFSGKNHIADSYTPTELVHQSLCALPKSLQATMMERPVQYLLLQYAHVLHANRPANLPGTRPPTFFYCDLPHLEFYVNEGSYQYNAVVEGLVHYAHDTSALLPSFQLSLLPPLRHRRALADWCMDYTLHAIGALVVGGPHAYYDETWTIPKTSSPDRKKPPTLSVMRGFWCNDSVAITQAFRANLQAGTALPEVAQHVEHAFEQEHPDALALSLPVDQPWTLYHGCDDNFLALASDALHTSLSLHNIINEDRNAIVGKSFVSPGPLPATWNLNSALSFCRATNEKYVLLVLESPDPAANLRIPATYLPALCKIRAMATGVASEFEITTAPRLQWTIRSIEETARSMVYTNINRVACLGMGSNSHPLVVVRAQITGVGQ